LAAENWPADQVSTTSNRLATGSVVRTIQSGKRITTLAISPDAQVLAAGEEAGNHLLS
jgi:hypothetical protein